MAQTCDVQNLCNQITPNNRNISRQTQTCIYAFLCGQISGQYQLIQNHQYQPLCQPVNVSLTLCSACLSRTDGTPVRESLRVGGQLEQHSLLYSVAGDKHAAGWQPSTKQ